MLAHPAQLSSGAIGATLNARQRPQSSYQEHMTTNLSIESLLNLAQSMLDLAQKLEDKANCAPETLQVGPPNIQDPTPPQRPLQETNFGHANRNGTGRTLRPRPRSAQSTRTLRTASGSDRIGLRQEQAQAHATTAAAAATAQQNTTRRQRRAQRRAQVTAGNLLRGNASATRITRADLSDEYLDSLIEQHAPMLARHTESTRASRPRFMSLSAWNANLARGFENPNSERLQQFLREAMAPDNAVSRSVSRGLDATKLALLSSYMLARDLETGCCICLENLAQGENATVLPCSHAYHEGCIKQWLKGHDTCPLCKSQVEPPETS